MLAYIHMLYIKLWLIYIYSIQFNSDICTRQLINYHVGTRDEHRKHDPQVGDFKKKSEFIAARGRP